MKVAAENICKRLKSQGIRGANVHEHIEERPRFTLFGRPFFNRKQRIRLEVRVPFTHEGYDNRQAKIAAQHKGLLLDKRLRQAIDLLLTEDHADRKKRGVGTDLVPWHQDGKHIGYNILVQPTK